MSAKKNSIKIPSPVNSPVNGVAVIMAIAGVTIVVAGLKAMDDVLIPLVVAFFLAMVGVWPLNWLIDKKVPRVLATVTVFLVVMFGFLGLGLVVANSVKELLADLPGYQLKLDRLLTEIAGELPIPGFIRPSQELLKSIDTKALFDFFGLALGGVVAILSQSLIVGMYVVFILLEASIFKQKLRLAFGSKLEEPTLQTIASDAQRYMLLKTLINLSIGFAVWLTCSLFGLKFSLLWGIGFFMLSYIPIIGQMGAIVPPIAFAILDLGLWPAAFLLLALVLIMFVIGSFVEPLILGQHLDISPFVALVALAFWGWIWGIVGMLFSVPLTTLLKIVCEQTPDLRWMSVLLGSGKTSTITK